MPGADGRRETRHDPVRTDATASTWTALDDHQLTRYLNLNDPSD